MNVGERLARRPANQHGSNDLWTANAPPASCCTARGKSPKRVCRSRWPAALLVISLVQTVGNERDNWFDAHLIREQPAVFAMLETAKSWRSAMASHARTRTAYALRSQQRCAQAQEAGRFDDEIVPLAASDRDIMLTRGEGNRPATTLEDLTRLTTGIQDGQQLRQGLCVTAGNASQLSDGASAPS